MIRYTYKIIEKHGFKYIDTSQYAYDGSDCYTLCDIELIYCSLHHKLEINYFREDRKESFYFHEDSTDQELDNILKTKLRLYKIKKLISNGKT